MKEAMLVCYRLVSGTQQQRSKHRPPKKKISLWPIRPSGAKINLPSCFFFLFASLSEHTLVVHHNTKDTLENTFPPSANAAPVAKALLLISIFFFFLASSFLPQSYYFGRGPPIEGILSTLSVNEEEPLLLLLFLSGKKHGLGWAHLESLSHHRRKGRRQEGVCPPAKKGTVFPRVLFSLLSLFPSFSKTVWNAGYERGAEEEEEEEDGGQ